MLAGHPAGCDDPVKAASAKGHTRKHTVTHHKHTAHHHTAKHHPGHTGHTHHVTHHKATVHTKAHHPHHAKARGLALGDSVACCAATALAESARLQGFRVSDEDVLALYWHTADDPDAGATIEATLEAAWRFGLAGVRPGSVRLLKPHIGAADRDAVIEADLFGLGAARGPVHGGNHGLEAAACTALFPADAVALADFRVREMHTLILGVDLPGPHTVLAAGGRWWSWGESWCPCEFPDAVIEEAWEIRWAT